MTSDKLNANDRAAIMNSVPLPGEVTQVVEHFFRHEAGKVVSTLTRIFGVEQLNRVKTWFRKRWSGRYRLGLITAYPEILPPGLLKSQRTSEARRGSAAR